MCVPGLSAKSLALFARVTSKADDSTEPRAAGPGAARLLLEVVEGLAGPNRG